MVNVTTNPARLAHYVNPVPLNEAEKNFLLLHNLYQVGGAGWKIQVLRNHRDTYHNVAQRIITLDREQSFVHWCEILKMYP